MPLKIWTYFLLFFVFLARASVAWISSSLNLVLSYCNLNWESNEASSLHASLFFADRQALGFYFNSSICWRSENLRVENFLTMFLVFKETVGILTILLAVW